SGITPLPWVARTEVHRLVLPLLQNRHCPHSAVYSGMTWSPGFTEVTPSPTSTTMPAPSWPSTTGNRPSGSSPDRVNASVWQTPVWVIVTSTSPFFGGATSISTICSGWPGPKATAARDFMVASPETGNDRMGGAMLRRRLFQVRADQRAHVAHAFGALFVGGGGLAEFLAQMGLHHLGHQAVDRTTDGGDLLQHRPAGAAGFQRTAQRIALAADAAHAGQDLLLFFGGVRHGGPARNYTGG